jgi:hypothetical protein
MWTCGSTGSAQGSNDLTCFHHVAIFDLDLAQVQEDAFYPLPMVNANTVAMNDKPFRFLPY